MAFNMSRLLIAILAKTPRVFACIIVTDTYFFKSNVSVINASVLRCFRQNLALPLSPVCFTQMGMNCQWNRCPILPSRIVICLQAHSTANEMNNQLKCKFRRSICDSEATCHRSRLENLISTRLYEQMII